MRRSVVSTAALAGVLILTVVPSADATVSAPADTSSVPGASAQDRATAQETVPPVSSKTTALASPSAVELLGFWAGGGLLVLLGGAVGVAATTRKVKRSR